ncbi:MAG: hypothetical protein L6R38_004420, partial [Xanthoria sp. 2 TBL-2021]
MKTTGHSRDTTLGIRDQSLVKRDIDYNWYKCNGGRLLKMIQDNDRPKTNPQDPSEWRLYEEGQDLLQGVNGAVQPALDAMGYAHLRSGDFVTQTGVQDREFKADGQTHPATNGKYRNYYIILEDVHTIIATSSLSPRHNVGKDKPLPSLSRWSDWTWAIWQRIWKDHRKTENDLRYIIRDQITTYETKAVMHKITGLPPPPPGEQGKQGGLRLSWPGLLFTMDQEEGLSLLETAHGQGVAYLIRDHSDKVQTKKPT